MITADALKTLTTFTAEALTRAIHLAGYKYTAEEFTSCKFLGITNSGKFCYSVVYPCKDSGTDSTKVYLTYDQATGTITADY